MKNPSYPSVVTRIHANSIFRNALILAAGLGMGIAGAAPGDVANPPTAIEKSERVVSDSWITTKVKSEILANSITKGFHVRVKTRHGVVTLKGKLPTQDAIDQVKAIAEKIKGEECRCLRTNRRRSVSAANRPRWKAAASAA